MKTEQLHRPNKLPGSTHALVLQNKIKRELTDIALSWKNF